MKFSKLHLSALMVITIMAACTDEPIFVQLAEQKHVDAIEQPAGMMVLGPQLANPYALGNMRQAYTNITGAKAELLPTHLYVRFLPRDEFELQVLRRDTTLELFDFPLDHEIVGSGTYFHDPELPVDAITWQYCAVPANYAFPESIHYEVLEQLFLPEVFDGAKSDLADRLDDEALRLAGYAVEEPSDGSKARKRFKPSGRITVHDNTLDAIIGIHGLRVIARSWFTTKHAFTDANGDFLIDHTFKGHCNYWIKWERADFDIRSGNWGQAWCDGPRLDGRWNHTFHLGSVQWQYAHIFRAAHMYYYGNDRWGIKTPPKASGILKRCLHIGAMDKDGTSHYFEFNKFFTTPQIKVFSKRSNGIERQSRYIYGTTIHELAHASHWEMCYSYGQYVLDFIANSAKIPESWASCVEHVITSDIYNMSHENLQDKQLSDFRWPADERGYTPLFIDCIDTYNQRDWGGSRCPIDRVSGYTLSQIESAIKYGANDTTDSGYKGIIKGLRRYDNPTHIYLEELFGNYRNL